MSPLFAAALEVQAALKARDWQFCIIGGLASIRWGIPRLTRDVDVTLLAGFGGEEEFISGLLDSGFRPRIADAADFALRHRVLLVAASNEVPIDIALGGLPYEQLAVERATEFEFEAGCVLRICSAEDLMVQKLFAGREIDWFDVKGVAARTRGVLDWDYIETQLAPLAELKEDPSVMARLEQLKQCGGPQPAVRLH